MPDLPSIYDPSALLNTASPSIGRSAGSGSNRLAHAAVQFESVLLGQWLQSAEKSFATVPGSEDSEDAGGDQMMSFAMQQLAGSIAASGGLGIARLVQRGLEKADASRRASEGAPSEDESAAKLSPHR